MKELRVKEKLKATKALTEFLEVKKDKMSKKKEKKNKSDKVRLESQVCFYLLLRENDFQSFNQKAYAV
jgi:hypothetical protein